MGKIQRRIKRKYWKGGDMITQTFINEGRL